MAASKKHQQETTTAIAEPPADSGTHDKKQRPFQVTQVVEVVEEVTEEPKLQKSEQPKAPVEVHEHPNPHVEEESAMEDVPAQTQNTDTVEAKRKELVDELFERKSPSGMRVIPDISMHTRGSTPSLYIWAIGVIVACIVVGIGLFFISGNKMPAIITSVAITSTPTPTPTLTPTPTAELPAKSTLRVQVQNGGGKAGAASKMKTFLEENGYTVTNTGNADAYTYEKTKIIYMEKVKPSVSQLEIDLTKEYTLSESEQAKEGAFPYDIRVIVGKE